MKITGVFPLRQNKSELASPRCLAGLPAFRSEAEIPACLWRGPNIRLVGLLAYGEAVWDFTLSSAQLCRLSGIYCFGSWNLFGASSLGFVIFLLPLRPKRLPNYSKCTHFYASLRVFLKSAPVFTSNCPNFSQHFHTFSRFSNPLSCPLCPSSLTWETLYAIKNSPFHYPCCCIYRPMADRYD